MKRRVPLWLTLIPLLIGVGLYGLFWFDRRDDFRAQLQALFGPEAAIDYGGSPYRLSATVDQPRLRHDVPEVFAQFAAEELIINRQPWRPNHVVIHATAPRLQLAAPDLGGTRLDIEAAESLSSLNIDDERLRRLSATFDEARLWFGLLPMPLEAGHFEIHLRETPMPVDPDSQSATPPRQAQLVLRGEDVRLDKGDPLTLAADIGITAMAPVRSVAGWRAEGGTAEITRLTLNDPTGTVLEMEATLAPMPNGRLMTVGTIETVCPSTLMAAFRGREAEPEQRARRPVQFAFRGQPGDYELVEPEDGLSRVPVRNQAPPCPVLRR